MNYIFVVGILLLVGIIYIIFIFCKASKLDLIHYPDRGIDMCKYCQHEYQSWHLETMIRDLEQAAKMNINLSEAIWDRFCCDTLRNKLKARYGVVAWNSFSKMMENIEKDK